MNGEMMNQPLLISSLLVHAQRNHGDQWVVSRQIEGNIHRQTFTTMATRARQMAKALITLGIKPGMCVGTMAWNHHRHLELYYAASGSGAVLHTLNPRLHADQMAYIANHAQDQVLFFDLSFLSQVQALAQRSQTIKTYVALTDRAHMPETHSLPNLHCYEELLAAESDDYQWPSFDENSASSLCYTSGTTGNPKGVLYSHRSTVLHCYAAALPDALLGSAQDTILPVVPMFHVNAWGLPYMAFMVGAKLVLPGPWLDGQSLYELMETEGVTLSAGVPTVWQGLLVHMTRNQLRFSTMTRTIIGGSACSLEMVRRFDEDYGVRVVQGWGMTETSPLGTTSTFKSKNLHLPKAQQYAVQATQGRGVFGIEMKIVDAKGAELPWDGNSAGDLMVRGAWVLRSYFRDEGRSPLVDGWFPTGDVARIAADGYMQITDRSKDVIKSGGEWIGSIDLENIAMSHPAVEMAACIAAHHPKWDERPLLIVVKQTDADLTAKALLGFFEGKIAKWWTPDDVVFVSVIPIGPTGKMLKGELRNLYANHLLDSSKANA
jgi:fatty-acyl-CoA synthase